MKRKNGKENGPIDWSRVRQRIRAAGLQRADTRERKDTVLAERARRLARPTNELAPGTTGLRLATFALASERYGIEARLVVEIGRLSDFTPLPHTPPHLVGITNLRGEVLPIFDLRALLGIRTRALDDLSRLIVLGRGRPEFGLLADGAREIVALSEAELLPPPPSVSAEARHFMRGVTQDALVVLEGNVLLEDRRLFFGQGDDVNPHRGRSM